MENTPTTTTPTTMPPPEITFYDIASSPPQQTFAPNPWKTRYALNLKKVAYSTHAVDMPDIPSLRQTLNVPANRSLPDGSPYHTLPLIHDRATGEFIGDSFEIALYLDRTYPESGSRLFRPGTVGLTASLNARVDELFTKYVALSEKMPFPEESKERIYGIFAARFGLADLESMALSAEAREALFVAFENALGEFAKAYRHVGGTTDTVWRAGGTAAAQAQKGGREEVGPWLDGDEPVYADLVVGAWLAMMARCMAEEDWERVRGWQGGLWGRVHDALRGLREML
jgi:glutathione S-transferase